MPLVKILTSVKCDEKKKNSLVKQLSAATASGTHKPEEYVAAVLEDDAVISFRGEICKAAFAEVKGIGGLSPDVNKALSAEICKILEEELEISPSNIYINFTEVPATNWGWNGSTFG
jgi:phenylpyruvate tautomerase